MKQNERESSCQEDCKVDDFQPLHQLEPGGVAVRKQHLHPLHIFVHYFRLSPFFE